MFGSKCRPTYGIGYLNCDSDFGLVEAAAIEAAPFCCYFWHICEPNNIGADMLAERLPKFIN